MGPRSVGVEIDQLPRIGMRVQLIDHEQEGLWQKRSWSGRRRRQDEQMERPPLELILELPEMELLDAFLRTATTAFMFLVPLMVLLVGSFLM